MGAWLPIIGVVIPPLIKLVESLFGPKTGATKQQTVLDMLQPILQALGKNGTVNGPQPTADALKGQIDAFVSTLQAQGLMPAVASGVQSAHPTVSFNFGGVTVTLSQ